jgi:hypothetical protein
MNTYGSSMYVRAEQHAHAVRPHGVGGRAAHRADALVQVFEKGLVVDQRDAVRVGLCEVCCPRAPLEQVPRDHVLHCDIRKRSLAKALETAARIEIAQQREGEQRAHGLGEVLPRAHRHHRHARPGAVGQLEVDDSSMLTKERPTALMTMMTSVNQCTHVCTAWYGQEKDALAALATDR